VELNGDPTDPRADSLPLYDLRGADLHLIDVNLVMGNVVAQVHNQAEAYLAE
jgi:hypothetical protein